MRLIDADALVNEINKCRGKNTIYAQFVRAYVKGARTIDAAPVVRCKDCKFSNWYTGGDGRPFNYCTELEREGFEEAGYCSFGERKDDERFTRTINWVEAEQHPSHSGSFLVTEECGPFSGGINATSIRWFDSQEEKWWYTGGKVIAWAELPKPYKRPAEK